MIKYIISCIDSKDRAHIVRMIESIEKYLKWVKFMLLDPEVRIALICIPLLAMLAYVTIYVLALLAYVTIYVLALLAYVTIYVLALYLNAVA